MQKFPRQSAKEFFSKGISIIIRRKRSYIKTLEPRLTLFLENQTFKSMLSQISFLL